MPFRQRRRSRREERARRPRSLLTPLTIGCLLVGAGIASALQASGALDVNLTVLLAIATCVVGAALVVSAWAGRARGLILLGLALVLATAVSSAIDVPLRGGFGETHVRPLHAADVLAKYELGGGRLWIDLRGVPLAGATRDVRASVGFGRLQVDVPSAVRVEIDAHVGAGDVKLFGRDTGGWDRGVRRAVDGDTSGAGVLHLRLRVGAGEIDVHRFAPGNVETLLPGASS